MPEFCVAVVVNPEPPVGPVLASNPDVGLEILIFHIPPRLLTIVGSCVFSK